MAPGRTSSSVPRLLQISIEAAASSGQWRFQRRLLERLPDHAANAILSLLLTRRLVTTPQLQLFGRSVTIIHLSGTTATAEALSYVSEFL